MAKKAIVTAIIILLATSAVAGIEPNMQLDRSTEDSSPKVDIVFIFDRSDSMDKERYELAQELGTLDEYLVQRGVKPQYALFTYERDVRLDQGLTDDYNAIDQALHYRTDGSVENASEAVITAKEVEFRPGAKRVIVLITDEDDDSSSSHRSEAKSELEEFEFVAISPSRPETSNCALHSPPCDNRTANELRTIAEDVDGDWIDVHEEPDTVIRSLRKVLEDHTSQSQSETRAGSTSSTASSPNIERTNFTINRTTVEIGEPLRLNVTVMNYDARDNEFDLLIATTESRLVDEAVNVAARSEKTVSFNHSFSSPGNYEIYVNHQFVGELTVTPLRETRVALTSSENTSQLTWDVSDARASQPVEVDLENHAVGSDEVGWVSKIAITPTGDRDFRLAISTLANPPTGTTPLPEHVRAGAFVLVESGLSPEEIASVSLSYSKADETHLYRYNETTSSWEQATTTVDDTSDGGKNAIVQPDRLGLFALVTYEPAFTITDFTIQQSSVSVGEPVRATATVENRGLANGTFEATLRSDGSPQSSNLVYVPTNETRTVTLEYHEITPGTYVLEIGQFEREVTVKPISTPEPDSISRTGDGSTAAQRAATAEDGVGSIPGSIIGGVVLVIILGLVMVILRT